MITIIEYNKTYLTDYLQITINGENLSQEVVDNILKTVSETLADTNIAKNFTVEVENEDYSEIDFYEL